MYGSLRFLDFKIFEIIQNSIIFIKIRCSFKFWSLDENVQNRPALLHIQTKPGIK